MNRTSFKMDPLSPERYKVVFTANADFKRKLDLARDLLRHAVPDGDLVAIIGRALDLLIEQTLGRRFAKTKRSRPRSAARAADGASTSCPANSPAEPVERTASALVACPIASRAAPAATGADASSPAPEVASQAVPAASGADRAIHPGASSPEPSANASAGAESSGDRLSRAFGNDACVACRGPTPSHEPDVPLRTASAIAPPAAESAAAAPPLRHHHSRHLPSAARRAVLERDGLRCTWIGPDGARCESRAWLEHDHIMPRGLGGDDDPANLRIRCRAHNRLAAEQVYGQASIARIIARRRARKEARTSQT